MKSSEAPPHVKSRNDLKLNAFKRPEHGPIVARLRLRCETRSRRRRAHAATTGPPGKELLYTQCPCITLFGVEPLIVTPERCFSPLLLQCTRKSVLVRNSP